MKQEIEVELRALVSPDEADGVIRAIRSSGVHRSSTKRLSVMCFGNDHGVPVDIRVRVTNGACEVVAKSGSFDAHNRVEVTQTIERHQFMGMVRIFAQCGFEMKVGERETDNYSFQGDINVSIVHAGQDLYVELEKMSNGAGVEDATAELSRMATTLSLYPLDTAGFDELCARLTENVDWHFAGSDDDYDRLSVLLERYA